MHFLLAKKIDKNIDTAVKFRYNNNDNRKFKLTVGTLLKYWEKIICKLKVIHE